MWAPFLPEGRDDTTLPGNEPGWGSLLSPEVAWTTEMWIWLLVIMVIAWPIDRRISLLLVAALIVYKFAGFIIRFSRLWIGVDERDFRS